MTYHDWALKLHGREYLDELTPDEERDADASNVVIIFGRSDDLCELRGAIYDEVDCYEGGMLYLTPTGLFDSDCNNEDCPYARKERAKCKTVKILWCDEPDYSWTYETDIPHETFDIMEDGEKYCRGIVFHASSLN